MTRLSALLNGLYVSDIHTCYIMFNGDWIRTMAPKLRAKRFGFNPEIVAKIAKEKRVYVSVKLAFLTMDERKVRVKNWCRDGIKAVWELLL